MIGERGRKALGSRAPSSRGVQVAGTIPGRAAWVSRMTGEASEFHASTHWTSHDEKGDEGHPAGSGTAVQGAGRHRIPTVFEHAMSPGRGRGYRVSGRRETSTRNPTRAHDHFASPDKDFPHKRAPIICRHSDADFLPLLARFPARSSSSSFSLSPDAGRKVAGAYREPCRIPLHGEVSFFLVDRRERTALPLCHSSHYRSVSSSSITPVHSSSSQPRRARRCRPNRTGWGDPPMNESSSSPDLWRGVVSLCPPIVGSASRVKNKAVRNGSGGVERRAARR